MHITTFYSFKGGVGRTQALVNVGVELALRGRDGAECLADLTGGTGDDQPEEERNDACQRQVVDGKAEAARHPPGVQPFDSGSHRGCDHQSEEEQRQQDAQLPERKGERDDADDDQRRDRGFASDLSHDLIIPRVADPENRRQDPAAARRSRAC